MENNKVEEKDYLKRRYNTIEMYLELALEITDPNDYDLEGYVDEVVNQIMLHYINKVDDDTFDGMFEAVHKHYREDIVEWYEDNYVPRT